tara:strand:+ start:606 stop:992 length:387 start_codon:yes stop_codon:yes gene_type:complete
MNFLFLCSRLAPNGISKNGMSITKYLEPHATKPCQACVLVWYTTLNTKNDKSKMHSDLFFLKKSGNEKNTVNRIGAKIKRPAPGANSIPNDEVKMYEIGLVKTNPYHSSEPRACTGVLSSDWTYLKVP